MARTRIVPAALLVALGAGWVMTGATGARATTAAGQGNALAEGVAVLPKEGSLAVGVIFGEALAGHTNQQAKAQSQDIDLGTIGTSLTSSNCGKAPTLRPEQIPQPLIVESGEPNATTGITQTDDGGAFSKFGQADTTPYARSVTVIAPFSIPGVLSVGGGTVTSWSGVVNGERAAGATADISGLVFPAGASLSSLHWGSTFPSGGGAAPTGTFTIGHAVINGAPVPTQNPAAVLAQLNAVVNAVGIQITPPKAHMTSGIEFVDPLGISVVPNSNRDGILGAAIQQIQPVRSSLVAALLKAYCQANTAVTVADIAVGSISGAGSFNVLFGGVQSTSGELAANGFNLGLPSLGAGGVEVGAGSPGGDLNGSLLAGGSPAIPGSPAEPAATTRGSGSGQGGSASASPAPAGTISRIGLVQGKRGGALAAISLAGLLLIAALAEGDRRMMRRAQRVIPDFDDD